MFHNASSKTPRYAAGTYSTSLEDDVFYVCCPKKEFKDPDNIPKGFEKLGDKDVYRISVNLKDGLFALAPFIEQINYLKSANAINEDYMRLVHPELVSENTFIMT